MADPDNLSKMEKTEKLDNFLKTQKRQSPRKREVTLSKVNEEAAFILEEFLKQQLRSKSVTSDTFVGIQYKKVTNIENGMKETNGDDIMSSYFECESLEDNIPYADEDDIGIRAKSEPPNAQSLGASDNALLRPEAVNNYRLVKSKSLSPCPSHPRELHLNLKREVEMPPFFPDHSSFITNEGISRGKSSLYPPPPPPPSTPYTSSEQSSKRSSPVLNIHQTSDSSTSSPLRCISDKSTPSPITSTSDKSSPYPATSISSKSIPSPVAGISDKSIPSPATSIFGKSIPSPVAGILDKRIPSPVTGSSDKSSPYPATSISSKSIPSPVAGISDKSIPSPATSIFGKSIPSPVAGILDKRIPSPVTGSSDKSSPYPATSISSKSIPSPVAGISDKSIPSPATSIFGKSIPSPVAGISDKRIPSPVTGSSDKSTPSPVSLSEYDQGTARSSNSQKFSSLPESDRGSSSKTHIQIPPSKIRHRSGSISSADTVAEEIDERKKKSVFKRARERLSRALTIQKRKKDSKDENNKIKKETKLRKRINKSKKLNAELNDALELDGPSKESIAEDVENGGFFGTLRRLTWGSIRKKKSIQTIPERKHHGNIEDVYKQNHSHTGDTITSLGKTKTAEDFSDTVYADGADLPKDESHLPNTQSDTFPKFQKQTSIKSHVHLDISSNMDLEMDDSGDKGKAINVPFGEKSEEEKEAIYQKIAERLVVIGDNFMADNQSGHSHTKSSQGVSTASSPNTKSEVQSSSGETNPDVIKKTQLTSLEKELTDCFKQKANQIDERLESEARNAVLRIIRQGVTYNNFQREVTHAIGHEVGWNQLSALFHITKRAVAIAEAGGAVAVQFKEWSLQYFADKYASWIVGQGGWDSMLSDEDTDVD